MNKRQTLGLIKQMQEVISTREIDAMNTMGEFFDTVRQEYEILHELASIVPAWAFMDGDDDDEEDEQSV